MSCVVGNIDDLVGRRHGLAHLKVYEFIKDIIP